MGLFGETKKKDPREKLREMKSSLRKESYKLDREIGGIQRKEKQFEGEIKRYAKSGNMAAAKLIAKEVISSRRAVNRMYAAKAQMNSVMMEMDHQAAAVRMAGALQSSTQVMQSMSRLVKIPEIQATMMEMSKEMMKMGMIEEMVEDTMDSVLDADDMEEEVEQAVEKILAELTGDKLNEAPDVGALSTPAGAIGGRDEEEDPGDMMDMQRRLEQLRS